MNSKSKLVWWARETFAILFWTYVVVKLFIFDIDNYFMNVFFPQYIGVVKFKVIFIMLGLAVMWLVSGSKLFFKNILYLLAYPFVFIFWKIPKNLIGKNLTLIVTAILSLFVAFKAAKKWFIASSFFLAGTIAILIRLSISMIIFIAMLILFVILCRHFFLRIRNTFRPQFFLNDILRMLKKENNIEDLFLKEFRKSSGLQPDEFEKNKYEAMKNLLFGNYLARFVAYKLRNLHESRVIVFYSLLQLAFTFIFTIIIFSLEYFALSQIDVGSFSFSSEGSFFNHLYFSFNKILTIDEEGFRPLTALARIITSLESVFGVLIGVILLSFVTTIIKEKFEGDLENIIKELDYQAEEMSRILLNEFNASLEEVEIQVKEKEPSIVNEIEKIKPTQYV